MGRRMLCCFGVLQTESRVGAAFRTIINSEKHVCIDKFLRGLVRRGGGSGRGHYCASNRTSCITKPALACLAYTYVRKVPAEVQSVPMKYFAPSGDCP